MHTERILRLLRLEETGVPIYVQLREQFLAVLGSGALKPGEQMPTMREVAVALRVDLNTVRHAYDELERIGAITLVRGRGSFVARPPVPLNARATAAQAEQLARQTIATARAMGIDPAGLADRIAAIVEKETKQKEGRST